MKDIINKYIEQEVKAIKNIPINGIIENVIEVIFQNVHLISKINNAAVAHQIRDPKLDPTRITPVAREAVGTGFKDPTLPR